MSKAIKTLARKFVHLNQSQGSHGRVSALPAGISPGWELENPPHRDLPTPGARDGQIRAPTSALRPCQHLHPLDGSSARGGHPHLHVNYDNERVARHGRGGCACRGCLFAPAGRCRHTGNLLLLLTLPEKPPAKCVKRNNLISLCCLGITRACPHTATAESWEGKKGNAILVFFTTTIYFSRV